MHSNIQIAVVDDMPADRERMMRVLADYAAAHGVEWQTACFSSGEELLSALTPGRFSIVFLDVMMGGISGMETARRLRAADRNALVVFVTTEADFAVEGYDVDAAGFLVKGDPRQPERFERLMERLKKRLQADAVVELAGGGHPLLVPAGDILFAEVLGHDMQLHTTGGVHTLRMTIEQLKPLLPQDGRFFECHRGIVVNLDAVKAPDGQNLSMKSGETVPVSRRKRTDLEHAYASRCFARMRDSL